MTAMEPRRHRLPAPIAWAILALAGITGCRHKAAPKDEPKPVPEVAIARPERASIRWMVRQPGTIEAFEATPIVPRIAGYVEKWDVDIGDRVKKGRELARLWVPDLVAQLERRKAEVEQARRMLAVAEARMGSATAAVEEARALVGQSRANLGYREAQHGRVNQLLSRSVVNKEVDDEVTSQVRSAEASVREAEARVARAEADRRESQAVRDKARVDIAVAEAALAESTAMVGYATLTAPFDGIVSRRRSTRGTSSSRPSGPRRSRST
jgi:HlyD family secretion protein